MHQRIAILLVMSALNLSVLSSERPAKENLGQLQTATPISFDTEFVKAAISRLRAVAAPESRVSAIEKQERLWTRNMQSSSEPHPTQADVLKMYREIGTLAHISGVKSEVPIRTARADARVMYEPVDDRGVPDTHPKPTAGLTNLTESMEIGVYYMWTERNGRVTSDKNFWRRIVKVKEDPITLVEDR